VAVFAAHPGEIHTSGTSLIRFAMIFGRPLFSEPAAGALSILYAATSPEAKAGGCYGIQGSGGSCKSSSSGPGCRRDQETLGSFTGAGWS
jgi:hypothetical protein